MPKQPKPPPQSKGGRDLAAIAPLAAMLIPGLIPGQMSNVLSKESLSNLQRSMKPPPPKKGKGR